MYSMAFNSAALTRPYFNDTIFKNTDRKGGTMKRIAAAALALFLPALLCADNFSTGLYLLMDSYPETAAKGSFSGAASYGISSAAENPASIASLENFAYEAMHSAMALNMYAEKLSAAKSFDFGSIGGSVSYFNFGSIGVTGINSDLGPVFTSDTLEPYAIYGQLMYAKKFESFSIGMAVKAIDESISGPQWTGLAGDIGFIFEDIGVENLNLGVSALNLSGEDSGFSLPLTVKSALSYDIKSKVKDQLKLVAGLDYLVKDDSIKGGAGFDYALLDSLLLRAGFTIGNKDRLKFSAGFGLKVMGLNVNYAYVPDDIIGDTHKISLSGSFGKTEEEPEKPEGKGGDTYAEYKKSGDYYYENKQYRQALKYYEYINLIYWKELEDATDKEKTSFYQKLGICYYNIRDNARALQYFERAFYFDKDNEILRHWIKLLK
jgi:tetratricopeptide (TPR) repeat protein